MIFSFSKKKTVLHFVKLLTEADTIDAIWKQRTISNISLMYTLIRVQSIHVYAGSAENIFHRSIT
jgi:hypothetical protein